MWPALPTTRALSPRTSAGGARYPRSRGWHGIPGFPRVITVAKRTPDRAWLAEVASVALVQACQDARRAYRNWFDSLSGTRQGRRVGHPRFRSKRGRQSVRLTRNGFALHGARLYIPKVGDVRVKWSRPLPSEPSSVTVIKDADGRYYASFVVERQPSPLAACGREIRIDVGLDRLAVTSDGEIIANPRFLRARQRHLARAQRALCRKQKGSANRAKARRRVAVLHRKVRETRLDHAHKTALRLVRDNQAVWAEDLAITGLARTRLARSVHDGGWAQLLRLVQEKAEYYLAGQDLRNFIVAARGETADWQSPADELGEDWAAAFRDGAQRLVAVWRATDLDLPVAIPGGGHAPLRSRADQKITELAVHGWDLVKATGQQADLDPVLAEHALNWSRPMLRPEFRGPGQAFGPEVPVSPDAPIYQRLAGWFGRDPGWTPDGTGTRGANVE